MEGRRRERGERMKVGGSWGQCQGHGRGTKRWAGPRHSLFCRKGSRGGRRRVGGINKKMMAVYIVIGYARRRG